MFLFGLCGHGEVSLLISLETNELRSLGHVSGGVWGGFVDFHVNQPFCIEETQPHVRLEAILDCIPDRGRQSNPQIFGLACRAGQGTPEGTGTLWFTKSTAPSFWH